ncbi:MAG: NADH-quinone oxidoreductase subunit D [Caldisphaeraceae archaeon]|nr:NADH-quinone oxidoreductase subunit D [Caldisphaeraceae archaeon]MEB3692631.1 NADH-quinone oxidoreductase subunit D [Caldisphaeraceae archaeon]MEB3797347.1 NADH-quinone oxidoreductase subunit D [Caldisphaeraceae archaeon]
MVRINLPKKEVNTFYNVADTTPEEEYCSGLACYVSRNLNKEFWEKAVSQRPRTYCLGKCYSSPSSSSTQEKPIIEVRSRKSVIGKYLLKGELTLKDYISLGGFKALEYALTSLSKRDIIKEVEESYLRGRGGGGFPTGKKWLLAYNQKEKERYLIVNGDEGDPGAYVDRFIMEYSPFLPIEGALIAAHAVGAKKVYFYIRREYPRSVARVREAAKIVASFLKYKLPEIVVVVGKGSYVVGEETALINALMGRRPEPVFKPPYPTERGLYGKPTVVNNVETLSNIPYIISNGGKEYYELGFSKSRGTKLVSLNSLFKRPGIYEFEFGVPLKEIVSTGGGLKRGKVAGLLIGAPLSGVVRPEEFDTRLGYEELEEIGSSLGHGNIIAFNEESPPGEVLREILSFLSYESCGKCTPCRLGTKRLENILSKGYILRSELEEVYDIAYALVSSSLCGLGIGAGKVVLSFLSKYGGVIVREG